jgi:hypothetical protein
VKADTLKHKEKRNRFIRTSLQRKLEERMNKRTNMGEKKNEVERISGRLNTALNFF